MAGMGHSLKHHFTLIEGASNVNHLVISRGFRVINLQWILSGRDKAPRGYPPTGILKIRRLFSACYADGVAPKSSKQRTSPQIRLSKGVTGGFAGLWVKNGEGATSERFAGRVPL